MAKMVVCLCALCGTTRIIGRIPQHLGDANHNVLLVPGNTVLYAVAESLEAESRIPLEGVDGTSVCKSPILLHQF